MAEGQGNWGGGISKPPRGFQAATTTAASLTVMVSIVVECRVSRQTRARSRSFHECSQGSMSPSGHVSGRSGVRDNLPVLGAGLQRERLAKTRSHQHSPKPEVTNIRRDLSPACFIDTQGRALCALDPGSLSHRSSVRCPFLGWHGRRDLQDHPLTAYQQHESAGCLPRGIIPDPRSPKAALWPQGRTST
jgi:hypothetical protein